MIWDSLTIMFRNNEYKGYLNTTHKGLRLLETTWEQTQERLDSTLLLINKLNLVLLRLHQLYLKAILCSNHQELPV